MRTRRRAPRPIGGRVRERGTTRDRQRYRQRERALSFTVPFSFTLHLTPETGRVTGGCELTVPATSPESRCDAHPPLTQPHHRALPCPHIRHPRPRRPRRPPSHSQFLAAVARAILARVRAAKRGCGTARTFRPLPAADTTVEGTHRRSICMWAVCWRQAVEGRRGDGFAQDCGFESQCSHQKNVEEQHNWATA